MTITLPLNSKEETKLLALAKARGVPADTLIKEVIEHLLADFVPDAFPAGPKKSSLGLLAHLGSAPSAQDIDEVRKDMFGNFPRNDF